jgi:[acyl-carrier-protein] S-malonyltransferase
MARAFIFPGQGSQAVGMGKALAENFTQARRVFEEVNEALLQPLSTLMFDGPESDLILTENAQPALMAVSLAVIRVLQAECGLDLARDAAFVAGHSLGEYSALAATGALSIWDTARLLQRRGQAMQAAVPVGKGAMAALLGADLVLAREISVAASQADGGVCEIANDNGGGQVVISGSRQTIEKAIDISKEKGVKRAVLLPVSAPFHCTLMEPAARAMAQALAQTAINIPVTPVVANVTALPVTDPETIRELLVKQVTGAVRWRECVSYMADHGVTKFVECGSGKVLSGLLKRIAPEASGLSVGLPSELDAYRAFV